MMGVSMRKIKCVLLIFICSQVIGTSYTMGVAKDKSAGNEKITRNQKIVVNEKTENEANETRKVRVALIDSGIDYSQDIEVKMRKNFIPGEDEVSILYEDSTGHGTSIAGMIGAKKNEIGITGVCPEVTLYSARVLDAKNEAPIGRVIEAIHWAIKEKVNIINISFGTKTDSKLLHEAVQTAYEAGILIIAAAGNQGVLEYPAAYEEVMAVGAVNRSGDLCSYSPIDEKIEVVAPGERIISSGAFDGVLVCSGTSIAAAQVTGMAALLWEKDLTLPADFIRNLIQYSANFYGEHQNQSFGVADLNYALWNYDTFKEVYEEGMKAQTFETEYGLQVVLQAVMEAAKEKGILTQNMNPFAIEKEPAYAEGCWTRRDHAALADDDTISNELLCVLKAGARASDEQIPGMTSNPQWHGYWRKKNEAGEWISTCNYIASYLWLTKLALAFPDDLSSEHVFVEPIALSGMPLEDFRALTGEIDDWGFHDAEWKILLEDYGVNNQNKRYFTYGIALHTVSDMFAHSTYYYERGNYQYISHERGADYHEVGDRFTNRWECAVKMGAIVVENAMEGRAGSLKDYATVIDAVYDTKTKDQFYLRNFSKNAKAVNEKEYEKYRESFEQINYEKINYEKRN